jgi:hypothetical protein
MVSRISRILSKCFIPVTMETLPCYDFIKLVISVILLSYFNNKFIINSYEDTLFSVTIMAFSFLNLFLSFLFSKIMLTLDSSLTPCTIVTFGGFRMFYIILFPLMMAASLRCLPYSKMQSAGCNSQKEMSKIWILVFHMILELIVTYRIFSMYV